MSNSRNDRDKSSTAKLSKSLKDLFGKKDKLVVTEEDLYAATRAQFNEEAKLRNRIDIYSSLLSDIEKSIELRKNNIKIERENIESCQKIIEEHITYIVDKVAETIAARIERDQLNPHEFPTDSPTYQALDSVVEAKLAEIKEELVFIDTDDVIFDQIYEYIISTNAVTRLNVNVSRLAELEASANQYRVSIKAMLDEMVQVRIKGHEKEEKGEVMSEVDYKKYAVVRAEKQQVKVKETISGRVKMLVEQKANAADVGGAPSDSTSDVGAGVRKSSKAF